MTLPSLLHHCAHPGPQVMTTVPPSALCIQPSPRLATLSRHKTYPPLLIKENSKWDWGEWDSDITAGARTAEATPRVCTLAASKEPDKHYQLCRGVQWTVSPSALSHVATERVQKLAEPKMKNSDKEDYDPSTWTVSRGALAAQASPRISELAAPLPRKCRVKK